MDVACSVVCDDVAVAYGSTLCIYVRMDGGSERGKGVLCGCLAWRRRGTHVPAAGSGPG